MTWTAVVVAILAALAAGWWAGRRGRLAAGRAAAADVRRLERRLAQESAEEARVQALLDAAGMAVSDAILHVDAQNQVRWATPAARSWFAIDEGAEPTLMMAIRSVELQDAVEAAVAGQPESQPLRIRDRTYRIGLVKMDDGGTVIAMRDDTELDRLTRARRDLVANVSHDLRTPLTSIGLLADSLLTPRSDDAAEREAVVDRIRDQIRTLQSLADDMVALNQLESGRALLRLHPERLADMARVAADGIAPQLRDSRVEVVVDLDPDTVVLADAPHIVRVFTNLLDNARRFSPPGGTIRVGAAAGPDRDRIEVFVADEGPGIAPADLERIFERFYRSDRARTHRSSGLGLAIARHIVTGHGGEIHAENNRERGATFRFTLLRG